MSVITDSLTSLMNTVRSITGSTNKLSVEDAITKLNQYTDDIGNWKHPIGGVLNNTFSSGYYYGKGIDFQGKPANISNTDKVRVIVVNYNSKVLQVFITPSVVWSRNYINNSWTDWKLLGGGAKALLSAFTSVRGCLA